MDLVSVARPPLEREGTMGFTALSLPVDRCDKGARQQHTGESPAAAELKRGLVDISSYQRVI